MAKTNSRNDEVPSEGGDCKESFIAFEDCVEETEKKKDDIGKCLPMLMSCMKAHSDQYQPFLTFKKNIQEESDKETWAEIDAFFRTKLEYSLERYFAFIEEGGCKESSMTCEDCKEEAEKKNENAADKCADIFSMLVRCMEETNSYHYQPFLALKKSGDQRMKKELDALVGMIK